MSTYRVSELIASTNSVFLLDSDHHTVVVHFLNKVELLRQLCSDGLRAGSGLSLHFEHLTSDDPLPVIDVYLNCEDEKNYIGSMGLYGIAESSADGRGQDMIFDIGAVFTAACTPSNWSTQKFELVFITNRPLVSGAQLNIGRIALYYYEF